MMRSRSDFQVNISEPAPVPRLFQSGCVGLAGRLGARALGRSCSSQEMAGARRRPGPLPHCWERRSVPTATRAANPVTPGKEGPGQRGPLAPPASPPSEPQARRSTAPRGHSACPLGQPGAWVCREEAVHLPSRKPHPTRLRLGVWASGKQQRGQSQCPRALGWGSEAHINTLPHACLSLRALSSGACTEGPETFGCRNPEGRPVPRETEPASQGRWQAASEPHRPHRVRRRCARPAGGCLGLVRALCSAPLPHPRTPAALLAPGLRGGTTDAITSGQCDVCRAPWETVCRESSVAARGKQA